MAQAGDHVLAAHESERQMAVIVGEEVEALVGAVCIPLGLAELVEGLRADSVPSNIAEGCGREGDKELSRLLSTAAGSASELESQLLLAHDLEYLPRDAHSQLSDQVAEVKRRLCRLMQSLSPTG